MYIVRCLLEHKDYAYAINAIEGGAELGGKKYAKTFKTKKEAYKYMWLYFRVCKNDVRVEKIN